MVAKQQQNVGVKGSRRARKAGVEDFLAITEMAAMNFRSRHRITSCRAVIQDQDSKWKTLLMGLS
jgi:hypothetical protein